MIIIIIIEPHHIISAQFNSIHLQFMASELVQELKVLKLVPAKTTRIRYDRYATETSPHPPLDSHYTLLTHIAPF